LYLIGPDDGLAPEDLSAVAVDGLALEAVGAGAAGAAAAPQSPVCAKIMTIAQKRLVPYKRKTNPHETHTIQC